MEGQIDFAYTNSKVIYKSLISDDLKNDILAYYLESTYLVSDNGSAYFPKRRVLKHLPSTLTAQLKQELGTTISQYYLKFVPNMDYIRIYHSNYGIVKPHQDIPSDPKFTHTCLIYLTDDFYGGVLSVKIPLDGLDLPLDALGCNPEGIDLPLDALGCKPKGQEEKKNLTVTMEPRTCYGAIFQKDLIHFNDELLGGDKIILLVDCEIIY